MFRCLQWAMKIIQLLAIILNIQYISQGREFWQSLKSYNAWGGGGVWSFNEWIYCHHLELSKATSRIKVCLQAYPAKMYYTGHLAKPQFALHLLLNGGVQKQSSEGRTFIFIVSLKHIADSYWGCSFIPW